jgi:hypothetical protein
MDREGWQDQKTNLQPVQTKVDKGINKIIQVKGNQIDQKANVKH